MSISNTYLLFITPKNVLTALPEILHWFVSIEGLSIIHRYLRLQFPLDFSASRTQFKSGRNEIISFAISGFRIN